MPKLSTLALAVAGALAVSLVPMGSATAKVLERGQFHDEVTEVIEDFCAEPGLTVRLEGVVDGRFVIRSRGADQLAYYAEHGRLHEVVTNIATGESVTRIAKVLDKDHKVTNNGDGTLTIRVLATGIEKLYGPGGKIIAKNPGQVRFELLFDHAGTPSDPADDVFLDFLGIVKESTGRNDDFCAATIDAIG